MIPQTYLGRHCTAATSVVTGSTPTLRRSDFPRYYPAFIAWALRAKLQRGLHRYKPDFYRTSLFYRATSLPDKELRYLRTIIVIADIDEGLHYAAGSIATTHRQCLTFSHWSGVTPYTSSYEFAGSCVFDKQSPEKL